MWRKLTQTQTYAEIQKCLIQNMLFFFFQTGFHVYEAGLELYELRKILNSGPLATTSQVVLQVYAKVVVLSLWVATPLGAIQMVASQGSPRTICVSDIYTIIHNGSKITVVT